MNWEDKFSEPHLIKAGDKRIKICGIPPILDIRIVAEDLWQELIAENERLQTAYKSLQTMIKVTENEQS